MTAKNRCHTPETRKKMSLAQLGEKHWNHGKTTSPETKAKIAASQRGKPHPHKGHPISPENKEKLLKANTGRPRSEESRKKQAAKMVGRKKSSEEIANISSRMMGNKYLLGYKPSIETREKISVAMKGHKTKPMSEEHKAKLLATRKGCHMSTESRRKNSIAHLGEKHYNWKGGISFEPYCPKWTKDLRRRIRAFFEYQCLICGKTEKENGKKLSCHHVNYDKMVCCNGKPVRFAALCAKCHSRTNHDTSKWEIRLHRIIEEFYDGRSYFTKEEWERIASLQVEMKILRDE